MKFEIIRIKITPKNLKKFKIIDDRIKHPKFIKDRKYLEKEIVAFRSGNNTKKDYPERYDLTVFTYNQFEKPYLIVDGSHRLEALKQIFKRKELGGFDAILLPSNVLGANTPKTRVMLSRALDRLLKKEKLPLWIKKYDFEFQYYESLSSTLNLESNGQGGKIFVSWSNKNFIDSGGKYKVRLTLNEYQALRKL